MFELIKKTVILWIAAIAFCGLNGCGGKETVPELLDKPYASAVNQQWQQSLDYATQAVKLDPKNVSALMMQALACLRNGQDDAALEAARRAAELDPKNFTAQYLLGRLYAKRSGAGQDAALEPLRRALTLRPRDQNTLLLLIQISGRLNQNSTYTFYRLLTANQANRPEIANQIGIYFATRQKLAEAAKYFVDAYNAAPDNPQIVLNFALFADYYANQPQQAIPRYQRYLELVARNQEMAAKRAMVEARLRQLSRPN